MQSLVAGEPVDRLPIQGVNGWGESILRWLAEGLAAGSYSGRNVSAPLGLMEPEGPVGLPLDLAMLPRFDVSVLKKDDEYVLFVDEFGVTRRLLRRDFDRSGGLMSEAGQTSSMSHWVDFPVKDLASWKAIYEERFRPDVMSRLPKDWQSRRIRLAGQARTRWIGFGCFPFFGLFGPLRELMGLEGLVYAMADEPATVHTMIEDLTDFWLSTFEQVIGDEHGESDTFRSSADAGKIRLDQVMFFEDMCATKAPIIGPATFRRFLTPGYRKVIGGLREMGVSLFLIDTDGNAWDIIPEMLAAGINGLIPCEVQAGMDAARLRETFPQLYIQGGIAKGAIARGGEELREEMKRRFTTAWQKGRYAPRIDHGAPPDIPWANLQEYAKLFREWAAAR